jgi:hypothetical protein
MRETMFFAIICIAMLGCNNTSEKAKDQMVKNDYPAYVIQGFMNGCLEGNLNPDATQTLTCSCLIEKIQNKYTAKEFLEISDMQNGSKLEEYQSFLNKAAAECISKTTPK